jgi:peptidoglycan/LPS O-acetylase OafA/YrhL
VAVGVGLLSPSFVYAVEAYRSVYIFGLTAFYVGSGCILVGLLLVRLRPNILVRALAYVGAHSYSIYLWHLPITIWLAPPVFRAFRIDGPVSQLATLLLLSVGIGIATARLVEMPFIKLRDRFFPSRVDVPTAASAPPPRGPSESEAA